MLSNEDTCVRVLDMKGLGAANPDENVTATEVNAGIMDYLVEAQRQLDISFDRILYFLPFRGKQTRIDGHFREEIKALHHMIGDNLFRLTVIAATQEKEYQSIEFTSRMLAELSGVVKLVFKEVNTPCPPIIYVPLSISSNELLHRVKTGTDKGYEPVRDMFTPTSTYVARIEEMYTILTRENCTKCCGSVGSPNCHPRMVYPSELSSGLMYISDKITEFFFYSDKICDTCQKSFGTRGCTPVGQGNTFHNCNIVNLLGS